MRIFAVVVLYMMDAEDAPSYRSLIHAAEQAGEGDLALSILLYDNSPDPHPPSVLPPHVTYVHDVKNNGVASAYNYALDAAGKGSHEWLLTLDQDTNLPANFFSVLWEKMGVIEQRPDVGAIVPQIYAGQRNVSPHSYVAGAWPRYFAEGYTGLPDCTVFAFNSGSILRVSALQQIGGYSDLFWLDASDLHLYKQLDLHHQRVYVLGALKLQHDLSHLNAATPLSPKRLGNILSAESAFWDMDMPFLAGLARNVVMIRHLIGQLRRREEPELCRLVWNSILDRTLSTRKRRLVRWQRDQTSRLRDLTRNALSK